MYRMNIKNQLHNKLNAVQIPNVKTCEPQQIELISFNQVTSQLVK